MILRIIRWYVVEWCLLKPAWHLARLPSLSNQMLIFFSKIIPYNLAKRGLIIIYVYEKFGRKTIILTKVAMDTSIVSRETKRSIRQICMTSDSKHKMKMKQKWETIHHQRWKLWVLQNIFHPCWLSLTFLSLKTMHVVFLSRRLSLTTSLVNSFSISYSCASTR